MLSTTPALSHSIRVSNYQNELSQNIQTLQQNIQKLQESCQLSQHTPLLEQKVGDTESTI